MRKLPLALLLNVPAGGKFLVLRYEEVALSLAAQRSSRLKISGSQYEKAALSLAAQRFSRLKISVSQHGEAPLSLATQRSFQKTQHDLIASLTKRSQNANPKTSEQSDP
jgi:hypothetical protein